MRTPTGLFIVFEGGDGVGKSTQVVRVAAWLRRQFDDVVVTREPGDSVVGRGIRSLVLDPATGVVAPRAETLLYAADKAQHVHEVVLPALERGAVVLCDRYVDSMLAYQGAGRTLRLEEVERVARWATADLRPHLTVLLDMDPARAVAAKADKDRLEGETEDFHRRVRQGFLDLAAADPAHYLVLAARDTPKQITAAITGRVQALITESSVGSGMVES